MGNAGRVEKKTSRTIEIKYNLTFKNLDISIIQETHNTMEGGLQEILDAFKQTGIILSLQQNEKILDDSSILDFMYCSHHEKDSSNGKNDQRRRDFSRYFFRRKKKLNYKTDSNNHTERSKV